MKAEGGGGWGGAGGLVCQCTDSQTGWVCGRRADPHEAYSPHITIDGTNLNGSKRGPARRAFRAPLQWPTHCAGVFTSRGVDYFFIAPASRACKLNRPDKFPASPELKPKPSVLRIHIRMHVIVAGIIHERKGDQKWKTQKVKQRLLSCFVWLKSVLFNLLCVGGVFSSECQQSTLFLIFLCIKRKSN